MGAILKQGIKAILKIAAKYGAKAASAIKTAAPKIAKSLVQAGKTVAKGGAKVAKFGIKSVAKVVTSIVKNPKAWASVAATIAIDAGIEAVQAAMKDAKLADMSDQDLEDFYNSLSAVEQRVLEKIVDQAVANEIKAAEQRAKEGNHPTFWAKEGVKISVIDPMRINISANLAANKTIMNHINLVAFTPDGDVFSKYYPSYRLFYSRLNLQPPKDESAFSSDMRTIFEKSFNALAILFVQRRIFNEAGLKNINGSIPAALFDVMRGTDMLVSAPYYPSSDSDATVQRVSTWLSYNYNQRTSSTPQVHFDSNGLSEVAFQPVSARTKNKIYSSPTSNQMWYRRVSDVLNGIYLSDNAYEYCRYLFKGHFVKNNKTADSTFEYLTFWPEVSLYAQGYGINQKVYSDFNIDALLSAIRTVVDGDQAYPALLRLFNLTKKTRSEEAQRDFDRDNAQVTHEASELTEDLLAAIMNANIQLCANMSVPGSDSTVTAWTYPVMRNADWLGNKFFTDQEYGINLKEDYTDFSNVSKVMDAGSVFSRLKFRIANETKEYSEIVPNSIGLAVLNVVQPAKQSSSFAATVNPVIGADMFAVMLGSKYEYDSTVSAGAIKTMMGYGVQYQHSVLPVQMTHYPSRTGSTDITGVPSSEYKRYEIPVGSATQSDIIKAMKENLILGYAPLSSINERINAINDYYGLER